jgi:hypothetical protein
LAAAVLILCLFFVSFNQSINQSIKGSTSFRSRKDEREEGELEGAAAAGCDELRVWQRHVDESFRGAAKKAPNGPIVFAREGAQPPELN